jgi:putative heme uptake system protein
VDAPRQTTYLLLDGENLDMALGSGLLGRRPAPDERPRWERVLEFVEREWAAPVHPLFFLNASAGTLPMPFIQAIKGFGYRAVPLSGPADVKVVDVAIQRTLDAIAGRPGNVMLGSHDGDFLPQVERLLDGSRHVGVLAFRELVNARYTALADRGLEMFDLEDDARCFTRPLPRLRIIDIDDFDPAAFL